VRCHAVLICGIAVGAAGCGPTDTGVHVHLHLQQLQAVDELRFHLIRLPPPDAAAGVAATTVVDPETTGRFLGPFPPGDQDVIIYLADDLDGSLLRCEAAALHMGSAAGRGSADVVVERQKIKTVDIFMVTSSDPAQPPLAERANGQPCSIGAECVSGACTDGVCCESDCQMSCHSCALADTLGLCRPVAAGSLDARGKCDDKGAASCQTNGLCDATGRCAVYPAGTICEPARCVDNDTALESARTCDGSGKCEGGGGGAGGEGKGGGKMSCPAPSACVSGACV
jgi:hypothetical protein